MSVRSREFPLKNEIEGEKISSSPNVSVSRTKCVILNKLGTDDGPWEGAVDDTQYVTGSISVTPCTGDEVPRRLDSFLRLYSLNDVHVSLI